MSCPDRTIGVRHDARASQVIRCYVEGHATTGGWRVLVLRNKLSENVVHVRCRSRAPDALDPLARTVVREGSRYTAHRDAGLTVFSIIREGLARCVSDLVTSIVV